MQNQSACFFPDAKQTEKIFLRKKCEEMQPLFVYEYRDGVPAVIAHRIF